MSKTNFATGQLRSLIDRVLRLKAEQDELSADVSEVYKEAHSAGFDKNAIRAVVNQLRKEEKNGPDRVQEADAIVGLYLDAYKGDLDADDDGGEGNHTSHPAEAAQRPSVARRGASGAVPRVRARETHDPNTGEITSDTSHPASEPRTGGAGGEAGEDHRLPSSSPAAPPYDPMTGELDPGPMPEFLKRRRQAEATE